MWRGARLLALIAALAACDTPAEPPDESTLAFNIDPDRVTVSGLSSGAYMAGQLHVAYSSRISGAALIAGGPWNCADGSVQTALAACIKGGELEFDREALDSLAGAGRVDDPANLANDRVWIFHGAVDPVVHRSVAAAAADFYREYLAPEQVAFVDDIPAGHGMPTVSAGLPCDELASPWINACGYDAAGELLAHLHGELAEPMPAASELRQLDQQAYGEDAQLWDYAYLYAPQACLGGAECALHVALHGCQQSAELVGDAFATLAGYNGWAEANRIVVLYPQVRSSHTAPMNPLGCWDWWGYTGDAYATREGPQVAAVMSMIDALMRDAD
jgi:poly(3-hydroxybutyrate) depolymerase